MFDSAGELQFPPGFIRGKEDPRYYSKLKAAERNKPGVVDLKVFDEIVIIIFI